jgi:hypothetical protein
MQSEISNRTTSLGCSRIRFPFYEQASCFGCDASEAGVVRGQLTGADNRWAAFGLRWIEQRHEHSLDTNLDAMRIFVTLGSAIQLISPQDISHVAKRQIESPALRRLLEKGDVGATF